MFAVKVWFSLLKRFVNKIRHHRHRLQERKQINSLCSFILIVYCLVAVGCRYGLSTLMHIIAPSLLLSLNFKAKSLRVFIQMGVSLYALLLTVLFPYVKLSMCVCESAMCVR